MREANDYLSRRYQIETNKSLENLYAFYQWQQQFAKANRCFADALLPFLEEDDILLELASSYDENVCCYLPTKFPRHIEVDSILVPNEVSSNVFFDEVVPPLHCYVVCNGIFQEMNTIMRQVYTTGKFTVGICGDKHDEYFQACFAYYRNLHNYFHAHGIDVNVIDKVVDSKGKMRIYALNYQTKGTKTK